MSSKNGVGQIIKAFVTVVTLIALTSRFCVIKATLADMFRLTRGALNAIGPAQLANGLITLHIVDEILDVDLHGGLLSGIAAWDVISIHHPQMSRPWNPIRATVKTIDELLSDLDRLDVTLWVDGDRLRCKAPKDTMTPEILTRLRERKEEMLEFLAMTKSAVLSRFPSISPVSRAALLPLSFSQENLWILEKLIPGNSFSNLISAIRIVGQINVEVLKQVYNEIIRRHEVLRTTFANVEGRPIQVISPVYPCALLIEDLSVFPEDKRGVEFFQRASQEYHKPFNLEQGPLLRVILLRISEEEHVLLQIMHHIISDDWSRQVLNREVAVLYEAFSNGCPSPLPELPIQYADFAAWQHQLLNEGMLEAQLSYWKQQLKGGNLPPLNLPTDYPRPTTQSFRTSRQTIRIPKFLSEALKSMGNSEGCTLFMMLLSAFKILLYSFTGQADIRVGTLVAIRNQSQFEGLIGLFINTLVFCTDLSDNPTFRVALQRVRNIVLEAYEHQDLPFEQLVQT